MVSGTKRKKVGILGTDAKLLGGVDFQTFAQEREWAVVTELKKQYEVTQIAGEAPIPTDLDALVVAQPSSLPQKQIDNLAKYVLGGGPTLLLMDPLPASDTSIAPKEPRRAPGGMGMFGGGPQPEPKGNLQPLLAQIGLEWPDADVVWDFYNPHKQWPDVVPNNVIISRGAARDAFGDDPASLGLQEIVFPFPGMLRQAAGSRTEFIPLLRTDDLGGTVSSEEFFSRTAMDNRGIARVPGRRSYVIAARIKGPLPVPPADPVRGRQGPGRPGPRPRGEGHRRGRPGLHHRLALRAAQAVARGHGRP